jgi:hypothetical protein
MYKTEFNTLWRGDPLLTATKPETKENILMAFILLFHIVQKY